MADYYKITGKDYFVIDFEDDIYSDVVSIEEVTVDPNNCVQLWTYDNEYDEYTDADFDHTKSEPYVFANDDDCDQWLDWHNGDGHANNPYYMIKVVDGVETHYDWDYFHS